MLFNVLVTCINFFYPVNLHHYSLHGNIFEKEWFKCSFVTRCSGHHPPRTQTDTAKTSLSVCLSNSNLQWSSSSSKSASTTSEEDLREHRARWRGQPPVNLQPLFFPAISGLWPQLPWRGHLELPAEHPGHARQPAHGVHPLGQYHHHHD